MACGYRRRQVRCADSSLSCATPSRPLARGPLVDDLPASALRGPPFLKESVQPLQIVDHAPMPTALFDSRTPRIDAREIFARVEVVRAQFRDVERDDVEALQVEGNVAHVSLREIFLQVGENEDRLAARPLLVQKLDRLQDAARDVSVRCALRVLDELVDLPANARFWLFAVLGRSSNVAFAMMSFSLKLPVSMRATANESDGSSRESM